MAELKHGQREIKSAVEQLIFAAALRSEKSISLARVFYGSALFCIVLGSYNLFGFMGTVLAAAPLAFFVLVSVYLFFRIDHLPNPTWLFPASAAMDLTVAFVTLAPDVIWPYQGYQGMVANLALSGLLIAIFASGFRLSVKVALFGSCVGIFYFLVLMVLDFFLNSYPVANQQQHFTIFTIFVFGASALAVILARFTRQLVQKGAIEAVRADRARNRLDSIIQDHHDLRSSLTSVTLNADMIREQVKSGELDSLQQIQILTGNLQQELVKVKAQIDYIKGETFSELTAFKETEQVDLEDTLDKLLKQLEPDFSPVKIVLKRGAGLAKVLVAGGSPILERIFFNLLVNAREGDGTRGAEEISIDIQDDCKNNRVEVTVSDDGPGFPSYILEQPVGRRIITKKKGGSGFGLLLVNGLVQASSGSLQLRNSTQGGAVVHVDLKKPV